METEVLESTKTRLLIRIIGEDHTLCNVVKDELNTNDKVVHASYRIKHPLKGNPEMLIETKGEDPKKALQAAIKSLGKKLDKIKAEAKNIK